jgi:hypothetical protein
MSLNNKMKSAARRRLYQNLTNFATENGYDDVVIENRNGAVHVSFDGTTVVLDVAEKVAF